MNNKQDGADMAQNNSNLDKQLQVESFTSFPVNQLLTFEVSIPSHFSPKDLQVAITNQLAGQLDRQLHWLSANKCRVSFKAPLVGVYTVSVELTSDPKFSNQFQAKAYDLSKVFINDSSGQCRLNESYEFSVDASEAGEGQLEIAVNEGEIPNQVQVLDSGMCIVNFVPEECVPHVVDIKFNGHNVNGCPFVVQVLSAEHQNGTIPQTSSTHQLAATLNQQLKPILSKPVLLKEERVLVDSLACFSLENIRFDEAIDKSELIVVDPENQPVEYKMIEDVQRAVHKFEFSASVVGDYTVELKPNTQLASKLPAELLEQFPFPIKVFDYKKVLVTDVTDGVIGHPIYFFIDASQAGSGNLEIRVSSKTRNVPNYPQSEANAKIRVNFTPTEAVNHSIDVKFNGIPVPGNPFLVSVAQYPQARLPVLSQDLLKYVAINESTSFFVDYIGSKENRNLPGEELTDKSCQVFVLKPDLSYTKLHQVELKPANRNDKQTRFKITFKPTKIGPYKLFIVVNNEILPASPIVSNVYNIDEVKVFFETLSKSHHDSESPRPIGYVNKPVTFTVDASRAGEGTLALAVVSGQNRNPVQTDVKVSDKGHGLYNLTFVPTEFTPHSIDMSFNDRVVPESPFVVDILDASGKSSAASMDKVGQNGKSSGSVSTGVDGDSKPSALQMVQDFESLSLSANDDGGGQVDEERGGKAKSRQPVVSTKKKKSLAYGLVNASNIVYLETGLLENNQNQIQLAGPYNEKVPFNLGKGSPQPGESKKPYIEYKPKSIGTHTISIVKEGNELHEYYVEICNPSLIKIEGLSAADSRPFVVGRPVSFRIDSRDSGDIQLDSITILGPKKSAHNKPNRDTQSDTILGRLKSAYSAANQQQQVNVEYSLERLNDFQQQVQFTPQVAGKYSVDIRCLGQSVGSSPIELEVGAATQVNSQTQQQQQQQQQMFANSSSNGKAKAPTGNILSREDELLQNIVVHGVSLKCSPVSSTGAFIIETNRLAQARDFDVLITDPNNSLVDVQCYLQQDGNLLAEWMPKRVGTHKIEVLYRNRQVPNSPFITEAFDPSAVLIENIKSTNFSVNDKISFKIDRRDAGYGELDVAISSPVGQELPIDVQPLDDGNGQLGELISFTPTVAGKYKISITFGGYDVPKSPITFTARGPVEPARVQGPGLRAAEVNRTAQFSVEGAGEGELKIRIECGEREIVPKVERRSGSSYLVKFKPTEVGYANVSLYWNGAHLEGSPYTVPVSDLSRILFLSGTNKSSNSNNQRMIEFEPHLAKEFTLDTSKCGPGELKAEAYCRANSSIKFSLPIVQYVPKRYRLSFICPPKPDQLAKGVSLRDISLEATYLIRFYYNDLSVPETLASVVVSPMQSSKQLVSPAHSLDQRRELVASSLSRQQKRSDYSSDEQQNNSVEKNNNLNGKQQVALECPPTVVALRGHGLVDAKCGEPAEFTIDGSQAGPGKPEVRLTSVAGQEVKVQLDYMSEKLYKASYIAPAPGTFTLNVLWDGKQVAGCPISVSVIGDCDPSKVICTGDGLKGGVLGEEIKCFIDTRRAGPGELTALCTGPQKVAFCELLDRADGTFILYIKPQEQGRQFLTIKYAGQHIPKSPFLIKVSGKPDPSKVRVYGPGVEHGVLSLYQSRFVCDTRGAGAGQLTVRIRGPKGAFRMETQRESQRDRTILCKYDPTEPGDYRIEIKWSGRHVPGSPFSVMIFDTQEELNRYLMLAM